MFEFATELRDWIRSLNLSCEGNEVADENIDIDLLINNAWDGSVRIVISENESENSGDQERILFRSANYSIQILGRNRDTVSVLLNRIFTGINGSELSRGHHFGSVEYIEVTSYSLENLVSDGIKREEFIGSVSLKTIENVL